MNLREKIQKLDQSIDDEQAKSLADLLRGEPWDNYQALLGPDSDDADEYVLCVVRFAMSIPDPEAFRVLLKPEQVELIDEVQEHVRKLLSLEL
jgi:hypothetical protein